MKTYDEYYSTSKMYCSDSLEKSESMYGKDWWKSYKCNLATTNDQDYDFIKPVIDKNDAPIVKNLTNVYNSEWNVLHGILSQMVIDYVMDNDIDTSVSSYAININLDKPRKRWSIYLKKSDYESIVLPESEPYDFPSYEFISDSDIIKKFDDLNSSIYKCVKKFFKNNSNDIPKMTNNVNFSIDDIQSSVQCGKLMPTSDSSLSVGWDRNGDENADELLVVSM